MKNDAGLANNPKYVDSNKNKSVSDTSIYTQLINKKNEMKNAPANGKVTKTIKSSKHSTDLYQKHEEKENASIQ